MVTASAVSQACKTILGAACKGKLIDPEHPAALEYLRLNDPLRKANMPNIVPGIDALYQDAVDFANGLGRLSASSIQNHFKIGYERARKIKNLIDAAGAFDEPLAGVEPVAAVTELSVTEKRTMIQNAQRLLDGIKPPAPPAKIGGDSLRAADERRDTEGSMFAPEVTGDELPGLVDFEEDGVDSLADWTLRDVVLKYGTHERFRGWLLAYKSIVDIGAKEIANAEKRGMLVPRVFIETHIIGNFDRAHINLMTDASQTIARRLIADIKAGATPEDCELFVAEQISRHIQEAKASIERALASV